MVAARQSAAFVADAKGAGRTMVEGDSRTWLFAAPRNFHSCFIVKDVPDLPATAAACHPGGGPGRPVGVVAAAGVMAGGYSQPGGSGSSVSGYPQAPR